MKPTNVGFVEAAATPLGVQSNIIVVIQWNNGPIDVFSDLTVYGQPRILGLSPIRHELKNSQISTACSFNVTLDDYDGYLKLLMDALNVEGSIVSVFLVLNDSAQMLTKGKIVGNSVWSEGNRTVEINVEASIQSTDVGYAPQEGDWTDLAPDAVGVPWPVCFGKPIHVRAHRIRKKTLGATEQQMGFTGQIFDQSDINDDFRKHRPFFSKNKIQVTEWDGVSAEFTHGAIHVKSENQFPQNTVITIAVDRVRFKGKFNENVFTVQEFNLPLYTDLDLDDPPTDKKDPNFNNPNVLFLHIDEGQKIPKLQDTHIIISGVSERTCPYNYVVKQDGKILHLIRPIRDAGKPLGNLYSIAEVYPISKWCHTNKTLDQDIFYTLDADTFVAKRKAILSVKDDYYVKSREIFRSATNFFWHCLASTEVTIVGDDPDIYIANLLPSNRVISVYARYKAEKKVKFIPVPKDWYQVQISQETVAGTFVTGILFYDSLTTHPGGDHWEDEVLYVTLESSIGPNPADILKWIIENHTDATVDLASYGQCATDNENFPCNFAIFEVVDALSLLEKIAFQARICLIYDSGIIYMRSMFYRPSSQATLDESILGFKSIQQTTTPLAECLRKLTVIWRESYRPLEQHATQYKARLDRVEYVVNGTTGNRVEEFTCLIYNTRTLVETMTKFWGYRKGLCWRLVTFKTFYNGCLFQPMDGVTLISSFAPAVTGVIESVETDPINNDVKITAWYPIATSSITVTPFPYLLFPPGSAFGG